jgi:hypothetical protein
MYTVVDYNVPLHPLGDLQGLALVASAGVFVTGDAGYDYGTEQNEFDTVCLADANVLSCTTSMVVGNSPMPWHNYPVSDLPYCAVLT